jgi:threonine dehydrogenase-like Zn-dependent dehydrogenase
MRALVLTADGPEILDHEPIGRSGEATIRLDLGGVCATDLELVKGYMGFLGVLGHEWVGVVEESPGAEHWVGKRVVGDINCPCGACSTCHAGRPTHCPNRTVLGIQGRDGAFSERFQLPAANLFEVPETVSSEAAVFVEPLAAACEILQHLFGDEAGGHRGIAGSPRGHRQNLNSLGRAHGYVEDLIATADAVNSEADMGLYDEE